MPNGLGYLRRPMEVEVILERLDSAIVAAFKAGREIMDVYGSEVLVERKKDDSPLTEADTRAHEAIAVILGRTGLPVLSEEGRHTPPTERWSWRSYWLVDPLDGTREFVKRNGEFTVNIALMQHNGEPGSANGSAVPMAGVLYAPVKDILYFAWKGGGAYRQHKATYQAGNTMKERVTLSERLPLERSDAAFTILASRSHRDADTDAFIRRKEQEHDRINLLGMGSALKFGLMAEGTADAYPRFAPTMEWDTAAGQIICEEVGLSVVDIATEKPMRYNKTELVNHGFIVQ